jgi:GntR family transcriptional repressor for pyruvate dehydrogenase complex
MNRTDHVTELAGVLEQAILVGEYRAGEQLPSERELSAQWGVSRSVVREALGRLNSLGLIRSRHGSGTRVEPPTSKQVELGFQRLLTRPDLELAHLAQVRLPLETEIAALAACSRNESQLEVLVETQRILGNPRKTLQAHVEADILFHATLADATGNPLFQVMLEPIQRLLIESRRRTLGQFGAQVAFEHHDAILQAIRDQDSRAAAEAMRFHIEANYEHLRTG